MPRKVQPVPERYHAVTPYLIVRHAAAAIEFYVQAFGAEESLRLANPNGTIGHAELHLGDSTVMLADEAPEQGVSSPDALGGAAVGLLLYVEDVDAVVRKAVERGATVEKPVANQFYGDRTGTLRDPFGHRWTVATHVEDVSNEEAARRFAALQRGGS